MKLGKRSLLMIVSLVLALTFSVFSTVAYLTSTAQATNTFTVGDVNISLDETDVDENGGVNYPVDTDGDGEPDLEITVDPDGTITVVDPTDPDNPIVIEPNEDGTYPDTDIDGDGDNDQIEVDEDGNLVITDPEDPSNPTVVEPGRDEENEYKLVPGKDYLKDPTVHVVAGSEESYVRMRVVINNYADLADLLGSDAEILAALCPDLDTVNWTLKATTPDAAADTIEYVFWYKDTVDASEATADIDLEPLFTTFHVPEHLESEDLSKLSDLQMDVYGEAIQAETFDTAEEAWAAFGEQENK